jgi:hypothetical protein
MKRLTIVIVIILTIFATLGVSAEEMVGNTYQIENVTIIFDADSQFSVEQQEMIARYLVGSEYGVSRANLICNIFGHKNTQEGVSTITHKAKANSPRCLEEFFTITICSRCDESTVERDGMGYITCCPEE